MTEPVERISERAEALVADFRDTMAAIKAALGHIVVGQEAIIEELLIAVLIGGHCLVTGLPGTAKTLMVRTLAHALGLDFKRIQFTPDLMPADVTGTDILDEDPGAGGRRWRFEPGPIFTQVLLADEINRTPPKTQAALLEAMQEHRVTMRGKTYGLDAPFVVLATQNPIELEGTYPLPRRSWIASCSTWCWTISMRTRKSRSWIAMCGESWRKMWCRAPTQMPFWPSSAWCARYRWPMQSPVKQ